MAAYEKQYPPYTGNDPYLFLCFSAPAGRKTLGLLSRLCRRGVRVWYPPEKSGARSEREANGKRMLSASLTVILLDEALRNDPAAKGRLLACQRAGHKIVCLNTDGGDSGLSIGLLPGAEEIRFSRGARAEEFEYELIRSEGFSRELIGEPVRQRNSFVKTAVILTLTLAALLLAAGLILYLFAPRPAGPVPPFTEQTPVPQATALPGDTVFFSDASVREAVREMLGGGLLSVERLSEVTTLHLEGDKLPEDLSDLALLPALKTILLSQAAAKEVPSRSELFGYEIELYGGQMP